ncbi:DUF4340 domain-containing protein [Brevifollis gellanilyticus]|uniref:DUF4340 domain-containing protein n=1 Tax=Brevifollis gellanilyticus TaxID=748831 RepID=A0A512MDP4_9BACT|nr:DUF4340 domain-containing protein [Brevifollis gellanilyticus]GEP44828.1 hypothetical protein BGE01nite_41190 [Brevifollis gellanilyticus]
MRLRTTLLLLLLALGLGAVIVGIERYMPSTRELAEMRKGPVRFEQKSVTQIDLDSSGGDGVSLQWDGAQWWVRRPFNDLADPVRVEKLLTELRNIGWINRVHREEFEGDAAWDKTQLGKPRHVVRLNAGSKPVLNLRLGATTPIEGSHYITLKDVAHDGEHAHYVAKTTLPDLLKATANDWRDPKLLRLPADFVTNLKLVQAGGQIELSRVDAKAPWMLVKPLSTRASKERVGELLSTLLNLTIKDASEPANGAAKPAVAAPATGEISAQEMKVSITVQGLPQPFDLTLTRPAKPDAAETVAHASYRKPVFTILSKTLSLLWSEPNQLRDRMLARIDKEVVSSIDITSSLHPAIHLEKKSDSWFIQRGDKLSPANGDRIFGFFDSLNTFQVLEFTADTASNLTPYGLDNPFLTASWVEAGAKPVKLLLGTNAASTEFFAKYDHEPSVYRIDATILPNIPQDPIKWKGLGVMRFTQFALRQISLAAGTAPPTVLKYDSTTAQWTGTRAGQDITPMLDRVKADKLAGSLAKLNVQDWVGDITNAIPALQKPALHVVVTLGEPGTNTGPTRDLVLSFAPTQADNMNSALFFGQLQGDADVFYIAKTSLLELLAPVFKAKE